MDFVLMVARIKFRFFWLKKILSWVLLKEYWHSFCYSPCSSWNGIVKYSFRSGTDSKAIHILKQVGTKC